MKYARYSEYEIRENKQGERVVIPARTAQLETYDPIENAEEILTALLNTGRLMKDSTPEKAEELILDFVNRYGLLGAIAQLPLNKDSYNHELVFIENNLFMASGVMATKDFEDLFFEKSKPKITKSFKLDDYIASKNYSEPITWIAEYIQLKINIRYRLTVTDRIQIQYEFHSLMGILNFTMANLLSAEGSPLKICKHCQKAFISQNKRAEFCSERCRNQFNVYKSRAKAKRNK